MLVKVIFLVLLASIHVQSQGAPFLIAEPASDVFEEGDIVKLTCSYVSPQDVQVYVFYRNDVLVLTLRNTNNAMIKFILRPSDSGNYTCDCSLGGSRTPMSNIVSFRVVEPCNCVEDHTVACEDGTCVCKLGFSGSDCGTGSAPVLTANPVKSVYEQGTNVTLTCSYIAPNDVDDMYRYFFNGNYIRNDNEVKMIISNLQPSDSGNYTCDAVLKWEGLTPMSNIVTLHVAAGELPTPFLEVIPNVTEFTTGDGLTLKCNHGAPDAPTFDYVTFYHDNWQLNANSIFMRITNLKPEDTGNYTCNIMYDSGPSPKSNVLSLVVAAPCEPPFTREDKCRAYLGVYKYKAAWRACQKRDASLVTPSTQQKWTSFLNSDVFIDQANSSTTYEYWINCFFDKNKSKWYWRTGRKTSIEVDWNNFSPSPPQPKKRGLICLGNKDKPWGYSKSRIPRHTFCEK